MASNSWASVLDQWENLFKTPGCVSRNESAHFSSCKPILSDSPNRAIISEVNQPFGGMRIWSPDNNPRTFVSDPKFVPEAHVYQIFDRNCPNPRPTRDCLRSADTFRPDAHDRYMSLGQILYIHSPTESPTPKHLLASGYFRKSQTRQAIRMCQGPCLEVYSRSFRSLFPRYAFTLNVPLKHQSSPSVKLRLEAIIQPQHQNFRFGNLLHSHSRCMASCFKVLKLLSHDFIWGESSIRHSIHQ